MSDKIVQYIVIRKDVVHRWPLGATVAQGCHAAAAAIAKSISSETTQSYLSDLINMTKCVLGVDNEEDLKALANRLSESKIAHHLWIEQPENVPVSLASAPDYKSKLSPYFKSFKLLN